MKTYQTYSSDETKKVGAELARQVLGFRLKVLGKNKRALIYNRTRNKCALILALKGDLGSGKTTFVQGFLRGLGVRKRVNSPTFVLMKRFKIHASRFKNAYHLDCYRIKKPKELLDLGLREILADPENIVLVEWPEKVSNFLPKKKIVVKFRYSKANNERLLTQA
ncbi:MAG: tRNA (adenosine(37)-N6)-threonylcarbamoyltransferase complex ATPase subunit type 1 TsaE [bacterium]|nr:tRNA (adenosine(37)-N6)-threonylcarbamoyltransferase complex ATPase subunit type 1 TsaE [bacterium]